jgi:cysteine desulfurase / selenocysteine lyase
MALNILYFNIAAAARCGADIVEAVHQQLLLESRAGPAQAFAAAAPVLERLRVDTAQLLGATPGEIAFCASGASAFGLAFAAMKPLRRGDRILVGRQEWGGNLANYARAAERAEASVEVIPCDDNGRVAPGALAAMLNERVKLISLTWLPANSGLINDAATVGRIARAAQIPYLIDAAQALGHVPVDVHELGCDVLVGPGRKHLRGPRGSAILYVRRDFLDQLDPVWLDVTNAPWQSGQFALVDAALRFDSSESSVAALCGLARSIEQALQDGVATRFDQSGQLAQRLRQELGDVHDAVLLDPAQGPLSGIVSFNLAGRQATDVVQSLAAQQIILTAHPLKYTPLDMQARGLNAVVRASLSSQNNEDEVLRLVAALKALTMSSGP